MIRIKRATEPPIAAGAGWRWLALAGAGWRWLALAGAGWRLSDWPTNRLD